MRGHELSSAVAMSQTRQEVYSSAFSLNGFSVGCRAVGYEDRYSPISSGTSKKALCVHPVFGLGSHCGMQMVQG